MAIAPREGYINAYVFESKEILVDEYGYFNHEDKMIYMDRLFNNFDITKDLIEFDN